MLRKNFILALVLSVAATTLNAQTSTTTKFAFNAEQLMDKVGMQKLFDLFDKNSGITDAAKKEERKKTQKAIAALYGAGIDFSKKIWIVQTQKIPQNMGAERLSGYEMPSFTLVIPVANRQVFEEQILKLANSSSKNDFQFLQKDNYSYVLKSNVLFVLTDKEFFIHNLPQQFSLDYENVDYYGTPVKADTVKREIRRYVDETTDPVLIQKKEKDPYTEVDKILPTGKVQRIYFYKEPKYEYDNVKIDTTVIIQESMDSLVADSVAIAADTAVAMVQDEPVQADTTDFTKYLNDSLEIRYRYIPYTNAEKEAHIAQTEIKQIAEREARAFAFMASCKSYAPFNDPDKAATKMLEAKDDIVMYSTASSFASPLKNITAALRRGIPSVGGEGNPILPKTYSSYMAVNFNNGHMQMKIYSDSMEAAYDKLYKPVTSFWPKELGDGKQGRIRMNFNTEILLTVINNYINSLPFNAHEKNDTMLKMKWNDILTGEVAASFITPSPKKTKNEPRMLVAFGVKDTKLAVQTLNTLSSEKLSTTKSYRFDVNGKYLLFDTEGGIGAKPIQVVPTAIAPKLGTNYGEVLIDLRSLITNATKPSKKNTKDFKMFTQFFNTISMVADKNETEGYVVDMKIDMGDKSTNALYNLIKLFSDKDTVKKKMK